MNRFRRLVTLLLAVVVFASSSPALVRAQSTPALGKNLSEIIAGAAREGTIDLTLERLDDGRRRRCAATWTSSTNSGACI